MMHHLFLAIYTKPTADTPGDEKVADRDRGLMTTNVVDGSIYYAEYETKVWDSEWRPLTGPKKRRAAVKFDVSSGKFIFPDEYDRLRRETASFLAKSMTAQAS